MSIEKNNICSHSSSCTNMEWSKAKYRKMCKYGKTKCVYVHECPGLHMHEIPLEVQTRNVNTGCLWEGELYGWAQRVGNF